MYSLAAVAWRSGRAGCGGRAAHWLGEAGRAAPGPAPGREHASWGDQGVGRPARPAVPHSVPPRLRPTKACEAQALTTSSPKAVGPGRAARLALGKALASGLSRQPQRGQAHVPVAHPRHTVPQFRVSTVCTPSRSGRSPSPAARAPAPPHQLRASSSHHCLPLWSPLLSFTCVATGDPLSPSRGAGLMVSIQQ